MAHECIVRVINVVPRSLARTQLAGVAVQRALSAEAACPVKGGEGGGEGRRGKGRGGWGGGGHGHLTLLSMSLLTSPGLGSTHHKPTVELVRRQRVRGCSPSGPLG